MQSLLDCHSKKNHSSIKLQDEDSKRLNHTLAPFWFPRNYFVPLVWTPETIEIILFVSPPPRASNKKRTVTFSVCLDRAKKKRNGKHFPSNLENYYSGPNSCCSKVGYCYSGNKPWLINWTNNVNTDTRANLHTTNSKCTRNKNNKSTNSRRAVVLLASKSSNRPIWKGNRISVIWTQ